MSPPPQEGAGAATSIAAFVASIPLSFVNDVLTTVALVVSITAGIYAIRRARRRDREEKS